MPYSAPADASTSGTPIAMGFKAQAYYATDLLSGNTIDSGAWVTTSAKTPNEYSFITGTTDKLLPFDNVTDVTIAAEADSIDTTTRSEARVGWKSATFGPKGGTITFDMRYNTAPSKATAAPSDAYLAFKKLQTAWLTNAEVVMCFLDQPYTYANAQGLMSNFKVTWTLAQPIGGWIKCSATLAVSSFPSWVYSNGEGVLVPAELALA